MWSRVPTCLALTEKCNTPTAGGPHDTLACKTALDFCETALQDPWAKTGMSTYDYTHYGAYEEDDWFAHFLDDKQTKKALGIDHSGAGDKHDGTYLSCSDNVYNNFAKTGDGAKDSTWAVRDLLENNVRVLLYAGGELHYEQDFHSLFLCVQNGTLFATTSGSTRGLSTYNGLVKSTSESKSCFHGIIQRQKTPVLTRLVCIVPMAT